MCLMILTREPSAPRSQVLTDALGLTTSSGSAPPQIRRGHEKRGSPANRPGIHIGVLSHKRRALVHHLSHVHVQVLAFPGARAGFEIPERVGSEVELGCVGLPIAVEIAASDVLHGP